MKVVINNTDYTVTKSKKVPQGNTFETVINTHPFVIFLNDEDSLKLVQ